MTNYRKKPVIIEDPYHYGEHNGVTPEWFEQALDEGKIRRTATPLPEPFPPLKIVTLEGIMTANHGDWIVKGIEGEIYPVANRIFVETYEKVEE